MNDAVSGTKRDATTGHNEIGQRVLRVDVDGLWIGRGMAKGLHGQVCRKA